MSSLAERLAQARTNRFVGRQAEIDLFRETIQAANLPFVVLHISGPGGIGKTTLLHEFSRLAAEADALPLYLDGRNIDASPAGFTSFLNLSLNLAPGTDTLEALQRQEKRVVLLIDTFERLAALDGWLRDHFLPQCPGDMLTVFASRHPPALPWRTDAGWQELMRTVALRNLNPDESRAYLQKKAVAAPQIEAVLEFTHGFPLALSLALEQLQLKPDNRFELSTSPDVIKALLEQLLDHVPSPAHREALEVCALARVTTEKLLAQFTGTEQAPALFSWLRELTFVQSEPFGLFPHDLARDAILTDLRWRNPEHYATLHRRARDYYMLQLETTKALEQQRVLFDYIFLHRDNPIVRPYFNWEDAGLMADTVKPEEQSSIVRLIEQFEGPQSAALAQYWLEQDPTGLIVYRDSEGEIRGLLFMLFLERFTAEQRAQDPATSRAWEAINESTPLRPGERATLFRYWLSARNYQRVGSVQSSIFLSMVQHYLTFPGLAYTLIPTAEPEFWSAMFAHVDIHRLTKADFAVAGKQFGVYGHDWRAVPPYAWLGLMAEREIAVTATDTPPPESIPLLVLSETEFYGAVRQALRRYPRDEALRDNPLLRSRLVQGGETTTLAPGQAIARLRQAVKLAAQGLQRTPPTAKFYEPVRRTYLEPAGTQEEIAEQLDLPFGTYRRHLKSGIDFISSALWQKEIGQ